MQIFYFLETEAQVHLVYYNWRDRCARTCLINEYGTVASLYVQQWYVYLALKGMQPSKPTARIAEAVTLETCVLR